MERTEALSRVVKVVADTFEIDPTEVVESASYVADLDADSLDLVELVMAFEEEFEVEIPEDAVEGIKTVGQTVDYVLAHA
ncbi:MAG: acyl carrier protein [Coriobacteriia bacterium]|nr:acyl carrier protein [Coriobacteriia bacterium]